MKHRGRVILDPCVFTIVLLKHISHLSSHALHWLPYSKTTCRNCLWESWSFWGFPGFSALPGCCRDLGEEIRLETGETSEFCEDRQGNVRDGLRRMTTTHQNEHRGFKDFLDMIGDRKIQAACSNVQPISQPQYMHIFNPTIDQRKSAKIRQNRFMGSTSIKVLKVKVDKSGLKKKGIKYIIMSTEITQSPQK